MSRDLLIRVGCAGLGLLNLWWGAWARLAPRGFFDRFPGLGHHWTAAYPPYNEHLITDLGATFLTLAFLLGVGAVVADRRVRVVVLAATLIFNALHLSFHAGHHGTMGGGDYAASIVSLVVGVLAPIVLLALTLWRPRELGRPPERSRQ